MYDEIFMDDYFEDAMEAHQNSGIKSAIASVLFGPLGNLIYTMIHKSHVDKSTVIDISAIMRNGVREKEAKKMVSKSVNFLIKNGFLSDQYADATVIRYSDLTPEGKVFMRGYYSAINDIREFDVNTAKYATSGNYKMSYDTGGRCVGVAYATARIITIIIRGGMGTVLGAVDICAAIVLTIFNVKDYAEYSASDIGFYNTMKRATVESVYDDVDRSIFDEDYFEPVTESGSDIIFAKRDFYYMSPKEAEKAYKGTIQRLLTTSYIPASNVNISPHKEYLTKGDLGWYYGISSFKAIINRINALHKARYTKADEFLNAVDMVIARYDKDVENAQRAAQTASMMSMAYGYGRH